MRFQARWMVWRVLLRLFFRKLVADIGLFGCMYERSDEVSFCRCVFIESTDRYRCY